MAKDFVVFRYDDYGSAGWTDRSIDVDRAVLDIFADRAFPLVIAVIPEPLSKQPENIQQLNRYASVGAAEIAVHGWDHNPSELLANEHIKSEFTGLPYDAQLQRLLKGKSYLEAWFGQPIHTFVPPWNKYDMTTLRACADAGIEALSADIYGPFDADGSVSLLPSTVWLPNLSRMIDQWESDPELDRVAVVCFHSFDIHESDSNRAVFSLRQLDDVLARIQRSSSIEVVDFRTANRQLKDVLVPSRVRSRIVQTIPFFRAELDSAGYQTEHFYRSLLHRWQLLRYLP